MLQLFWFEVVILVCIRNDEEIEQEFGDGGGAGVLETAVQVVLG